MNYISIFVFLGILLYLFIINFFKFSRQYERELGLREHKVKNGTISMGGIIFIIPLLVFVMIDHHLYYVVIPALLFYIIGFIDDLLKSLRKNNLGLSVKQKLALEISFSIISALILFKANQNIIVLGIYILAFISSSNAYNLTDGCDGLLCGICLIMGIAFSIIIGANGSLFYMHISLLGVLLAFLYFNISKAYIFMGDTGSLFLGAYFCALCIYLNAIKVFLLMNGIVIFETLSVIIQVLFYKVSGGKRIFKMAPFHHHLEINKMSEMIVDLVFILMELILVILSLVWGDYL